MTKALASIVLASVVSGSGNMASPQVTMPAPERKPLISGQVRLVSPLSYTLRQLPPDPVTGDVATYDFKPTVTTVDERAGIYDLSWIGYDQRVKSVRYQARDRLSVVVEAIVSRTSTDMIDYKYVVKSQLSSAQRLTVFTVQACRRRQLAISRKVSSWPGWGNILESLVAASGLRSLSFPMRRCKWSLG